MKSKEAIIYRLTIPLKAITHILLWDIKCRFLRATAKGKMCPWYIPMKRRLHVCMENYEDTLRNAPIIN